MKKLLIVLAIITANIDFIDDTGRGIVNIWVTFKKDGENFRSEVYNVSKRYQAIEAFKNVDMPKYKTNVLLLPNNYRPVREIGKESASLENLKKGDSL